MAQSVRRTIMLREKLAKPRKTSANRTAARKRIIRDVEDAIECKAEPDDQETLRAEFFERLDSPDLEDDIADRPIAEIITDICRDHGLGVAAPPPSSSRRNRPSFTKDDVETLKKCLPRMSNEELEYHIAGSLPI